MKEEKNDWGKYLDSIGLFFFFVGCAGVSIIVWIFNWVCWLNQCCCCDFLHNPVNKRIAWWMGFSFLLGVLACCISAFVIVNRFGFALEGSRCAFERIYYDTIYGQLKQYQPRWEGLETTNNSLGIIKKICDLIANETIVNCSIYSPETLTKNCTILQTLCKENRGTIKDVYIPSFDNSIKTTINFDFFDSKARILKGFFKILSMIYYCLLSMATTAAGVSMMFYACLKRQGYLITLMHVLWNIIRFFIFSFFLYGTAYGVFFLIIRDIRYCMWKIFEEKLSSVNIAEKFLYGCLKSDNTNNYLDEKIRISVIDLFNNPSFKNGELYKKICNGEPDCDYLNKMILNNTLGSFDCRFLKSNLHHLYKTLEDASTESRILSALSLCSSFFGAIAVYFFLLVMHHYNNELFFDSGKSIFKGFDGFGKGFKKKNKSQDPAYKKRKLRAEIELTSKNEEDFHSKENNNNLDDE